MGIIFFEIFQFEDSGSLLRACFRGFMGELRDYLDFANPSQCVGQAGGVVSASSAGVSRGRTVRSASSKISAICKCVPPAFRSLFASWKGVLSQRSFTSCVQPCCSR